MKKQIFKIAVFLLITINLLFGEIVSTDTAETIAINWYELKTSITPTISSTIIKERNGEPTLQIFNFNEGGFVIVSGNNSIPPVLVYSLTNSYTNDTTNTEFKEWVNGLEENVNDANINHYSNVNTIEDWNDILNMESNYLHKNNADPQIIGPLLTTHWSQGQYYNNACPENTNGPDGHVLVGCVAVAMAQIMNYHEHPLSGRGSHSYVHNDYGILSANFSTTDYNWANMEDELTSYNSDVANLLFHCGVSINTDYSDTASGAINYVAKNAFKSYFHYNSAHYMDWLFDEPVEDRAELLKEQLDRQLPVCYFGSDSSTNACHAFVCDGYDEEGGDYFHFNWGWGSNYNDTWTLLDDMNVVGFNFIYGHTAIINIYPEFLIRLKNCDYESSENLGGWLSMDNLGTSEWEYEYIGSNKRAGLKVSDTYEFITRLGDKDNLYHYQWNNRSEQYKLIWTNETIEQNFPETNSEIKAQFKPKSSIIFESNIDNISIHDPWLIENPIYLEVDPECLVDWIQPDDFRPLSSSNYNVFLDQNEHFNNIDPIYSVRASDGIYVTEDGIYEFIEWKTYKPDGSEDVNNDYVSFEDANSLETGVVFHQEGGKISGPEAVNMIPNYTLTIANDESLTIPAGANINFAEGFTIEVEGDLTIGSESGNRVNITGSGRSVTNELIKINNPNSNVNISNTTIQNTDCALLFEQVNNAEITNTEINNVNKSVKFGQTENANIILDFVQIKNSNSGILFEDGFKDASQESRLTVNHSVFSNITNYGIYIIQPYALNNSSSEQYIDIIQNTFYNCGNKGISYYDPPSGPFADVYFDISGTIFDNSDIYMSSNEGFIDFGNSSYNLFHNSSGYGDIDANAVYGDPLFINSSAGDFHLSANSPAIDVVPPPLGPPYEDPDGTGADIGAYYCPQVSISGNQSGELSGIVTVTGNVTVSSGQSLEINPGTLIKLNSGKVITVYGELIANGTSSNKVTFTKNGSNDWSKIYARTNSDVYLNHTILKDCYVGLHADNASSVNVYNSEFTNSVAGIWMEHCNSNHIDNNTFENNDYCGLFLEYATTNLNGNVISNNGNSGIEGTRVYGNYKYNNINDNQYGIYLYNDSSPDLTLTTFFPDIEETFRNNIIIENDYGVYVYDGYPQLGNYVVDMGYLNVTGGFNEFDNVGYNVYNEDNEIDARLNIWGGSGNYGDVETDPDFYDFLDEWGLGKTTGDDEEDIFENIIYVVADSLIADSLFTEAMEEYESLIDEMSKEDISKKTLVNIVALNRRLALDSLYQEEFTDKTLVSRLEKISNKYPNTPVGGLSLDLQVTANNWAGEYEKTITLGDKLYIKYTQNNDYDNAANVLYEQSLALRYKSETDGDLSKTFALIKQSEAKADLILSQYPQSSASNAVRMSRGQTPIMIDEEPKATPIPKEYALHNCYPNPFNPVTNIKFDLPEDSKISLVAYDVMGRKVWEYGNNGTIMEAGKYEIQWNGKTTEGNQLASGVYLIQLRTAEFVDVRKVVLLK